MALRSTVTRHHLEELDKRITEMERAGWTMICRGTSSKELTAYRYIKYWAVMQREKGD